LPILNDPKVYIWMGAGLPVPHELYHAQRWLQSVVENCATGQKDVEDSRASDREQRVTEIRECPVHTLRDCSSDELYLGDLGLTRWKFEDIIDKDHRENLIIENTNKLPGDPTIIWSLGYYLRPSYHGKGIMKAAIRTLLEWAVENMNVRHLRATAMDENKSSLSTLISNGFKVEKILPDFAFKEGNKTGLAVLELKYSSAV
ncbi:hypothetical protein M422DRAFT_182832, partial [Sphaerobolus stellatus SS14]